MDKDNMIEGFDRREFLKNAMAIGAGVAVAPLLVSEAKAATAAVAAAPAAAPAGGKLTMAEVLRVAREKLYPRCRVCPECNGVACAGEVPGFGGFGSGQAFKNNYDDLQRIRLNMRCVHDITHPDMEFKIFGETLSMPLMGANTGGVTYNMGGKMTEEAYIESIVGGCIGAGTIGFVADGIGDPLETFQRRMVVLKNKFGGKGVVIIKPRTQSEIIKRIRLMEEAGALAFGIDIDSAGRAARALPGQTVEPKTIAQMRELVKSTSLPFVAKGIMTVDDAEKAVEAGASVLVVSNHGGRVLDYTPGTCEVLPAIAAKFKGKVPILVDGAVRRGADVLKYLALGADATLIGRPLVRAAHGAEARGVELAMNTIRQDLQAMMAMTGTASVKNVSKSIIVGA
ncbi:alpha-hydroxy-acid oxidizing protein [Desulfovibrio intestinalis]|uniref:Isopentenyl diphosphate isomerase/L-lactate dehydrogenase-like FMN-dependent dehydrogenase n=1 Tax=Desulfovibrio intestinalis TaxID=58621 RepID=A0A7W8C2I4_9BACT|nr:alpha-hydroxy-acid oxidizing protein [Desulfovibrio intestinalis]MBB5143169.1 isopentenyl diphosphate isomerase/L-lactate dehydrogenase-like FMN-dependent dehydrogenase [Desulfovibrio intestinalis]